MRWILDNPRSPTGHKPRPFTSMTAACSPGGNVNRGELVCALGVCDCANRKWRWQSMTGDAPWELLGQLPA